MASVLLITESDIRKYVTISQNLDPKWWINYPIRIQERYILPVLGQAFYDSLCTGFDTNTNSPDEVLLIEKLAPAIINYTLGEFLNRIHFRVENAGVEQNTGTNYQPATFGQIVAMSKDYLSDAAEDLDKVKKFLSDNYALFPLYVKPSCGQNDRIGKYSGGIFFPK